MNKLSEFNFRVENTKQLKTNQNEGNNIQNSDPSLQENLIHFLSKKWEID